MSDRAAVALAVAVAVGAHVGGGPTPYLGALLVLVAVAARRPWVLCLAAALLAAGLAERAHAGLDPVEPGSWVGWATLVSDPARLDGGGISVIAAVDGRRVEATAHGPPAWALEDRLAGEAVALRGRLRPPRSSTPWLVTRRIVGRLDVDDVGATAAGSPLASAANAVRRTLDDGAAALPQRTRSLLAGVVLGDDREQPPELADDFRAAGLTHLLVVSGQNVAYVLVLARPLLAWLRGPGRMLATVAVVGAFVVVVRFEPSVLRAGAMAAVACVASALGRPAEGVRVLALAVAAVLLVDPLLVGSLGFGLSVGASAGILLLATRIAAALPGPRAVSDALAVTLAAQAGALPLLLPAFGAVPVATLPANLLAVPAAGPLMMWGLTGGLLAGVVDGPVRSALHAPTRLLTWWLAEVAGASASLPLGELRPRHAAAAALAVGAAVIGARRRSPALRVAGALLALLVLLAAAASVPHAPAGRREVSAGVQLWQTDDARVAVVGRGARPRRALEDLRRSGARCVDAIAVATADQAARRAASALARRCPGASVVAPTGAALPGWEPIEPGTSRALGDLVIAVDADGRLGVGSADHGSPGHATAPRAPPVRHLVPRRNHGHPQPHAGLVLRQGHLLRLRRLPAQGRAAGRRGH